MSDTRVTPEQSKTPALAEVRQRIIASAKELGLDAVGFAPVGENGDDRERLFAWLTRGYQASMSWMARDPQQRSDVTRVLPGARTVISVAINYHTDGEHCDDCGALKISRYAWGEDYHRVLGQKLKVLQDLIHQLVPQAETVASVDVGPIMEKPWAQRAGIGWIGKNANLLTRQLGSWVFLGEIITTLDLPSDTPHTDFCGSCTRCIEACPTDAISEPYVVNSQKCISYWTIEHRGDFPKGVGEDFDGWIFGCDICQEVCPWNRFEKTTREPAFVPRADATCPPVDRWLCLTEEEFQQEFNHSALRRARHEGLVRNIRSQRRDPLESVLKILEWEPIEDLDDIHLDELDH